MVRGRRQTKDQLSCAPTRKFWAVARVPSFPLFQESRFTHSYRCCGIPLDPVSPIPSPGPRLRKTEAESCCKSLGDEAGR